MTISTGAEILATDIAAIKANADSSVAAIAALFTDVHTWQSLQTFNAAGTGLAVAHNATIGGTLAVTGALTSTGNITATVGGGSISIQPNVTNGVIDAGAANLVIKSGAAGTGGLVNIFPTLQAPSLVLNKAVIATGTVPGIKQGIALSGSTTTSPASVNLFNISADTVAAPNGLEILKILHQFGGGTMTGTRNTLSVNTTMTAATGNSHGAGYGPTEFQFNALANDGGTGLDPATSHGNAFGLYAVANLGPLATFWSALAHELDFRAQFGSSVVDMIGLQIVGVADHFTQGARDDVGLSLNNQFAPTVGRGLKVGLGFGRAGGFFPVAVDGTIIGGQGNAGSAFTVAKGVDWSLGNATSYWLNLGGDFQISAAGSPGFNGHAPPAQPAAPVTLADVIAVIRGCGLSA